MKNVLLALALMAAVASPSAFARKHGPKCKAEEMVDGKCPAKGKKAKMAKEAAPATAPATAAAPAEGEKH